MQLSSGCRAIDALAQADEGHPHRLKVFEQRHQVPQVASEPVQSPANQHIDPPSFGFFEQRIKGWPLVLTAADATIYELRSSPAPSRYVAPEFL